MRYRLLSDVMFDQKKKKKEKKGGPVMKMLRLISPACKLLTL